jgi:hypothetical protein
LLTLRPSTTVAPVRGTRTVDWRALFVRADLGVIALWTLLVGVIGFARRDYNGDGMRHLPAAISSGWPHFGSTRWLLFPGLIKVIVRPFVMLGLVHDIWQAEIIFTFTSVTCGLVYLLCLRQWMVARGVDASARAASILLGAACVPLLKMCTDNMEATIPATLAVAGLTFAAVRSNDAERARTGILVAVGSIALATLLYQALILALGFLPLAVGPQTLRRQLRETYTLVACAVLLALVPAVMVTTLVVGGDTIGHAAFRAVNGDWTVVYRVYTAPGGGHSPGRLLTALVLGPGANAVMVPGNIPGLSSLIPHLRSSGWERSEAIGQVALLLAGVALTSGATFIAFRRRDWAWLFALAVLMLLPLARTFQYPYVKFYTLFPALLAIGALAIDPRITAWVGGALLLFNGTVVAASVAEGRRAYAANAAFEETLPPGSCWLTAGWMARETQQWTGFSCGLLRSFPQVADDDLEAGSRDASRTFTECLTRCFCEAPMVVTDEFTPEHRSVVHTNGFYYRGANLDELLWTPDKGIAVPRQPPEIFVYSKDAQEHACSQIREESQRPR